MAPLTRSRRVFQAGKDEIEIRYCRTLATDVRWRSRMLSRQLYAGSEIATFAAESCVLCSAGVRCADCHNACVKPSRCVVTV